jgi:hypothetical protein
MAEDESVTVEILDSRVPDRPHSWVEDVPRNMTGVAFFDKMTYDSYTGVHWHWVALQYEAVLSRPPDASGAPRVMDWEAPLSTHVDPGTNTVRLIVQLPPSIASHAAGIAVGSSATILPVATKVALSRILEAIDSKDDGDNLPVDIVKSLQQTLRDLMSPVVQVNEWMSHAGRGVRLPLTYHAFRTEALTLLTTDQRDAAKLYYFKTDGWTKDDRISIHDETSFREVYHFASSNTATVFYFIPKVPSHATPRNRGHGTAEPPENAPAAMPMSVPPPALTDISEHSCDSSDRTFREVTLSRDGHQCVACDYKAQASVLRAAHIVAWDASAGLMSTCDTINGLTLCIICHTYFEKHLWCVQPDGKILVAKALLDNAQLCKHFARLQGKAIRASADLTVWPRSQTFAFHARLFEAKRAEGQAVDFACGSCGTVCESVRGLYQHRRNKQTCR